MCVPVKCGPDIPGGVRVPGSRRRRRPAHQHSGEISLQPTKRGKQQVGRLVHGNGKGKGFHIAIFLFESITQKEIYIQYVLRRFSKLY